MLESQEMRKVYCDTMIALAKEDPRIVDVEADLTGAHGMKPFKAAYPDRSFNVGIAEANMVGVAAGLSACGKIPFVHSFATFASRRCFDQIAISVCYAGLNVKIVGSDPGVGAELNGGTHMALEDMGIMRTLPGMTVFEPTDSVQLRKALPAIVEHEGPVYIRLFRRQAENVFDDGYEFDLGKADLLRDGSDVTLIASGVCVANALQAAETLAQQEKAVELLKSKPEVEKVTPLNNAQLQKLIQPWLGDGVAVSDLPIPRLIDVKLKPGAEVDFLRWSEELAETAPQASLDNHKLWLNKLIKFADGLKVLALAVLTLVVLITSGAIFYCTQTSLGLHKYIIEILHLMGAKDTYVAQQYAKRTAWLGFLGGLYGLVLAIPTIFVIANLARQIEGGIISDARLNSADWTAILSLPLFSMLIAMSTAYYTVKKTLEKFM